MTSVLYLGNFSAKDEHGACFNTECHYARGFAANGCEVTPAQEPWRYPDESPEQFYQRQLGYIEEIRGQVGHHDLVLYTRTTNLPLDEATRVWRAHEQQGTVTAAVHLDLFYGLHRSHEIERSPMFTMQFVFTADGDHQAEFDRDGVNHYWLPAGVVEDECKLGTPRDKFPHEIIFVGGGHGYHDEWSHRQELLRFLHERYGDRFKKWGGPEERTIRGQALNDLYASAKVVVGDSLALYGPSTRYTSDRLFETLGRGGFLIFPRLDGATRLVPNLPTYELGQFTELGDQIDYWLDHDHARLALRDQLHAHVKSHHTYTQRARTILETVGLR